MNPVDLSAVIFVVLALAWAVYLIPKALSHHDELASDRLVEGHSDKVRILSRTRTVTTSETVVEDVADVADVSSVDAPAGAPAGPAAPVAAAPVAAPVLTRASARRAARNRRRVLGVLTLALAVVAGLAALAVLPWWTVAVPATLVVVFLVVARLSVRRMQQARATAPRATTVADRVRESADPSYAAEPHVDFDVAEEALARLSEDATGAEREDLEAALADDGSLWDPLPMTLPTYVNKARARRTVRTIELTGINSSGHDDSASALAREAEHEAAQATARAAETDESHRRVVGG